MISKEELEELYKRIDFVISFAWKYMLEVYGTDDEHKKYYPTSDTAVLDRINLAYIYFRNGYKELSTEDVIKYYEENKDRLYQKAIQLLCDDIFHYEQLIDKYAFTDSVPYPLPEEFDFLKVKRVALVAYFQNRVHEPKDIGSMSCIDALCLLPDELATHIIGIAAAAHEIRKIQELR